MRIKKNWGRGVHHNPHCPTNCSNYNISQAPLSKRIFPQAIKFRIEYIQLVLGQILFALAWDATGDDDRKSLLTCVDGLERMLIDLRVCGDALCQLNRGN